MKHKLAKGFGSFAVAMVLLSMVAVFNVHAATTKLAIIDRGKTGCGYPDLWTAGDPETGCINTRFFNFTTNTAKKGDTFVANIEVIDVTNLYTWQLRLGWGEGINITTVEATADPNNYTDIWIPPAGVIKGVVPPPSVYYDLNELVWGASLLTGSFTGSGILMQVQFTITKDATILDPLIECEIAILDIGGAQGTFLLNDGLQTIDFDPEPGYYKLEWVVPTTTPYLELKPSFYKANTLGEDVVFEVWARNVHPGWEIVGFEFCLMYNSTLLQDGYGSVWLEPGTYMEQFVNGGELGVLYVNASDFHGTAPPPPSYQPPYCYNWYAVSVMIQPGPGGWEAPFPGADGKTDGLLCKLHFTAIFETLSPEIAETDLTFFTYKDGPGHIYVMNQYLGEVPHSPSAAGRYRAPMRVLGLSIDLYTPDHLYGGKGFNETDDSYAPQELVTLEALVTYNDDPVQQKLVGFEVRHGEFYLWREATTDDHGIARISFRIPWPCENASERVLGEWIARATVEVAEQVANDTMPFKVWWHVEITSVEPAKDSFVKRKYTQNSDDLVFTVYFRTYRMEPVPVVITIAVYDDLGFLIGWDKYEIPAFGWGESGHYCTFYNDTHTFTIPMPSNTAIGPHCKVYANAFDKLPWDYGTPYCPEKSAVFSIIKE